MPPPTTSAKTAIMLALTIALSLPAFAEDVNEIPMCKEGATVAMSDDAMDSDTHMGGGGKNMSLHMSFTALRPTNEADNARAAALVSQLQHALAKYKDYHVAEADGFKPFHPEIKQQKVVHFTRSWYALKAEFTFNPLEPTSLLYQRTPDGGYKLIGAMYTDRKGATLDELNERVPLSVARWHRHVNFCIPGRLAEMKTADWTKFGPNGWIATKEACDLVGGRFFPQVYGWMVHVYPWETNPQLVWAH
jgi:hypothetical protein